MTTDQITNLVLNIAPAAITIFSMIGIIAKVLHQFSNLKRQVTDMKSVKETNDKINVLLQENCDLKKQINELLTKIDHVRRD